MNFTFNKNILQPCPPLNCQELSSIDLWNINIISFKHNLLITFLSFCRFMCLEPSYRTKKSTFVHSILDPDPRTQMNPDLTGSSLLHFYQNHVSVFYSETMEKLFFRQFSLFNGLTSMKQATNRIHY